MAADVNVCIISSHSYQLVLLVRLFAVHYNAWGIDVVSLVLGRLLVRKRLLRGLPLLNNTASGVLVMLQLKELATRGKWFGVMNVSLRLVRLVGSGLHADQMKRSVQHVSKVYTDLEEQLVWYGVRLDGIGSPH